MKEDVALYIKMKLRSSIRLYASQPASHSYGICAMNEAALKLATTVMDL
jgi:hypothetical protein